ncbi:DNA internalization-related competence protein ComEC/Rec2 [bacterium]|nr:DNA internalization-related competence protein ComEC/Rec2 [bacterium]
MINKEFLNDILQNRNVLMCLTSIIFMTGVLAFFSSYEILFAIIFTAFLFITLIFKLFNVKKVIIFGLIFYGAFFLTSFKVKTSDQLITFAPINSSFTGRIVSVPNSAEADKVRFFMEVENIGKHKTKGKALVTITGNNLDKLNVGQKIIIEKGSLRKPFYSTNPSQFDYSAYLRNFNIFTVIYSNDGNFKILKDKSSIKWKFLSKLNNTRKEIIKVHSQYLKSPNLEILGGIVFGQDAVAPTNEIKKSFINSGLLHILAASGMNVAFIYTFWFFILRFLGIPFKARVLSGILVIIAYTLMTGLGPSVIRASIMLIFVLVGKLIDRDTHSISLLSLVAVLMLIYNPAYINDVSFQLSFLVTFGLITTAQTINEKIENVPNWFKIPILIPLTAQIWIAPIQMFYFNTISLYSIFANISAGTLLSVISFFGFVSSVLAIIKPIANFVCLIFDFFVNYLLNILVLISNFFGNLPFCILETSHPNIIQLILYYTMLIIGTYLIKYNKLKQAFCTIVGISIILICTTLHPVPKDLEITAFDVGNADCFMIKTPLNKYFFIDTGKSTYKSENSQAKIIMLKYLKDRGIKNIEGIIVTHFDNDHSGGASDFIKNTNVKTLYLNTKDTQTQTARNIFKTAREINQNIKITENNETIYQENELKIITYKTNINGKNSSNDSSTITLLKYKNFETLFMADAGITSFELIKKYLPHNIEVLKVGHHGGPQVVDDNMIKYLNNTISIISTGINYFGHPNKGTLDILRKTNILRTDFLNSIKITTDGKEYQVYSFNPHNKKYRFLEKYDAK